MPMVRALAKGLSKDLGKKISSYSQAHQSALIICLITMLTGAGILGFRSVGFLESLELFSLDILLVIRPIEQPDPRIVIVEVTDDDLQRARKSGLQRQWPWSDRIFARLIGQILADKPLAVGVDKFLDLPTTEGRAELIQAIAQQNQPIKIPIVNATKFPDGDQQYGVELPSDLVKISSSGFVNLITDRGVMVRRALLGGDDSSFAFELTQQYLAKKYSGRVMEFDPKTKLLSFNSIPIPRFTANFGGYNQEDDRGYQTLINFRNSAKAFEHISAVDLLEGKIKTSVLSDRIVLIGITGDSVKDRVPSPVSQFNGISSTTPGVEIHAHIISQLLAAIEDQRPLIQVWQVRWEMLWIVAWTLWGGVMAAIFPQVWRNLIVSFSSIAMLLAFSYFIFVYFCFWLAYLPALLGLVVANVAVFAYQFAREQEERKQLMGMFSRHVSPELATVLWDNRQQFFKQGRIEGQEMYVTVLFTDMRNFSTAAEAQPPGDTLNWLNSYLSAIAEEIIHERGMVDKYIGDAVMAVFGVPTPRYKETERCEDAQNAVRSALKMSKKLATMGEYWQAQGLPEVITGIGINSGFVIAGSLGSKERLEYSVIGDSVNVAARLESLNKEVDGGVHHILISEETYQRLEGKFQTEPVGSYELKGRAASTIVYRVLAEIPQS
jgi:adenylate cyclase